MLISIPTYDTSDLLYDVFMCLNRNELEKSQLVSTYWNHLILKHENLLALRILNFLDLILETPTYQVHAYEEEFSLYTEISDLTPFKKCIFETVQISEAYLFDIDRQMIFQESFMQMLESIRTNMGQPIRAMRLRFSMGYLHLLPMFTPYIKFSEVQFHGLDDFLTFVEQKPKQLDGLKVVFYGLWCPDVSRFEHNRQIDFFKFVGETNARSSNRIAICFHGFKADSFLHRFLKFFSDAKTNEIENLEKAIIFEDMHLSSDLAQMLEKEHGFTRRRLQFNKMGVCLLETFELPKDDGWTMTIAFHKIADYKPKLLSMRHIQHTHITDCYVFVHRKGSCPDTLNRIMQSY